MLSGKKLIFLGFLLILPSFVFLKVSSEIGWIPIACYFFTVSLLTLLLNRSDKRRAKDDEWRIKEATLHLLELMGGWPTAYIVQRIIHHKTSKVRYQIWFWLIVLLHQIASYDYLNGGRLTFLVISKVEYVLTLVIEGILVLSE